MCFNLTRASNVAKKNTLSTLNSCGTSVGIWMKARVKHSALYTICGSTWQLWTPLLMSLYVCALRSGRSSDWLLYWVLCYEMLLMVPVQSHFISANTFERPGQLFDDLQSCRVQTHDRTVEMNLN